MLYTSLSKTLGVYMSNKLTPFAIAAGVGLYILAQHGNEGENSASSPQGQENGNCIVQDTNIQPGMVTYFNNCGMTINAYTCKKTGFSDVQDLFSSENRDNCVRRTVADGGVIFVGNIYDENASALYNMSAVTQVQVLTCPAPKSPQNIQVNSFECR